MSIPSLLLFAALFCFQFEAATAQPVLQETQRIELKGVQGRIDHMATDLKGDRLFVAALGNNTIEVIDLRSDRAVESLTGLREPQGLLVVPETGQLIATNGQSESARVYDKTTLKLLKEIHVKEDGDNIRYERNSKRIYIGCGSGSEGALAEVDAMTGRVLARISLSGHPESFQLEQNGERIFVNVPTAHRIEVVNRIRQKVMDSWDIVERDNFPMALDEEHARLFVGTRNPAKLLVVDTKTGKRVATLDSVKDADDIFYDSIAKRVYVSGGEGYVFVFGQLDPNSYRILEKLPTRDGARTALFLPEARILFVALPKRGDKNAEIRGYKAAP
jgi:DNA-binding beta-propeller fold protein YncE